MSEALRLSALLRQAWEGQPEEDGEGDAASTIHVTLRHDLYHAGQIALLRRAL